MEGSRGAFYDHAGALRDVVQNHMLQLLALVAMEPPATLKARDIGDAKLKVLRNLSPLRGAEVARRVVRGQSPEALRRLRIDLGNRLEADDARHFLDEIGFDADVEAIGRRNHLPPLPCSCHSHREPLERLDHQLGWECDPE